MTLARAWFAGLSLHGERPAPKPAEVRCPGGCGNTGRLYCERPAERQAPAGVTVEPIDGSWVRWIYQCSVCRMTGEGGEA